MKLQQFTAESTQKAIAMIKSSLGPNALIYSTRRVMDGVEVTASLPDELKDNSASDSAMQHLMSHLTQQVNELTQKITSMTFNHPRTTLFQSNQDDKKYSGTQICHLNNIFYDFIKCGFNAAFSKKLISHHFDDYNYNDDVTHECTDNILYTHVATIDVESDDQPKIIAIVGASCSGKTTSVIKLAKRYIELYGPDSVGVISTDYRDIAGLNQLSFYMNKSNLTIEYVESSSELLSSIEAMNNKKIILIDTHSVNIKESEKIKEINALLTSTAYKIDCLLTLPCHLQENILRDNVTAFSGFNLSGCILTNREEVNTIATIMSICIEFNLKVAYATSGREIGGTIAKANKTELISTLLTPLDQEETVICA